MATELYRQTELAKAREEMAKATARVATAKTQKARREAREDVEFWSNKVAYLACVKVSE
jgi:hypothetical protein